MSHEIRTPMNAILGPTHLLRRNAPTPAQVDRLTKIETAASHLMALLNDILDLSKIEVEDTGMSDFIAKPFEPDALFATLLRWLPAGTSSAVPPVNA